MQRASGSLEATEGRPPAGTQFAVEAAVIALCQDTLKLSVSPHDISSAYHIKKGLKDNYCTFLKQKGS